MKNTFNRLTKKFFPKTLAISIICSISAQSLVFSSQAFAGREGSMHTQTQGEISDYANLAEISTVDTIVGENRDITSDFVDNQFAIRVREVAGLPAGSPIMLYDVMHIKEMFLRFAGIPQATITNFAGLEHFHSLEVLHINDHHGGGAIASTPGSGNGGIDISVLPNLQVFTADGNFSPTSGGMQWIVIDNPYLTTIVINPASRLGHLDLSGAPALETLELRRGFIGQPPVSGISSLNITQNPLLRELLLSSTPFIAEVETSENPMLERLHLSGRADVGPARIIDFSHNINLRDVSLGGENISSFDWSMLTNIEVLRIDNNPIAQIDLALYPKLEVLSINFNQLSSLDISANPYLRILEAQQGLLTDLVIDYNPALREINIASNQFDDMSNINFAGTPNLMFLGVAFNELTEFNLADLQSLERLQIHQNNMRSPNDVIGWRQTNLRPGTANFQFWPQRMLGAPGVPVIATTEIPNLTVGQPFSFFFEALGNTVMTWTVDNWPAENPPAEATGLTLQMWGILEGTPLAGSEGTWNFDIRAQNSHGHDIQTITITILPASADDDISSDFDPDFLVRIRSVIGIPEGPISREDVAGISVLSLVGLRTESLAGIEHLTGLTRLTANNVGITALDLSANTALEFLNLSSNNFTELDLSANTALYHLSLGANIGISTLDLSANTALEWVSLLNNRMDELVLPNTKTLTWLSLNGNNFAALDLSVVPGLVSLGISDTTFTTIDLSANTALRYLTANNVSLAEFDVSANTALRVVDASGNGFAALDFSANTDLWRLTVNNNANLETLTVPDGISLEELTVNNNSSLAALDVTPSVGLRTLTANNNAISKILLPASNSLHTLTASGNNALTSIDLSPSVGLRAVNITNSGLAALDTTANTTLESLNVMNNSLVTLDLSENTALVWFSAFRNNLETLKLPAHAPHFESLDARDNNLVILDVSGGAALNSISVSNNRLTALDLSANTALEWLEAHDNELSGHLNLSDNTNLISASLQDNYLTSVDVTGTALGTRNVWGSALNVTGNNMADRDCVIGWQTLNLQLNHTFIFYPQRGAIAAPPLITTEFVPDGIVNEQFRFFFRSDSQIVSSWTIIWPHEKSMEEIGLGFNSSGELYGTPTMPGNWDFDVRVTNAEGFYERKFVVTIHPEDEISKIRYISNLEELQAAAEDAGGLDIIRFSPDTHIKFTGTAGLGNAAELRFSADTNIIIDGNGGSLTFFGNRGLGGIIAQAGASVIIQDLTMISGDRALNGDRTGTAIRAQAGDTAAANVTLRSVNHPMIIDEFGIGLNIEGASTLTLEGGLITNNNTGVHISGNGMFVMDGGIISHNTVNGVQINSALNNTAAFIMNNGVISENVNPDNVLINTNGVSLAGNSNVFVMNGGAIAGNTVGVNITGNGMNNGNVFTMNNGTISGNTVNGVNLIHQPAGAANGNSFVMRGGQITGHLGNAVNLDNPQVSFVFEGGTFANNGTGVMVNSGTFDINGIFNSGINIAGGTTNINEGAIVAQTGSALNGNLGIINLSGGTMNVRQGGFVEAAGLSGQNAVISVGADAILNIDGQINRPITVIGELNLHQTGVIGTGGGGARVIFGADSNILLAGRILRPAAFFNTATVGAEASLEHNSFVETGGNVTVYGSTGSFTVYEGAKLTLQAGGHIHGASAGVALDTQDDPAGLRGPAVFIMNGGKITVGAGNVAGVNVGSGNSRFYMHGGTIEGPSLPTNVLSMGNGVVLGTSAFFHMTGGEIINSANRGVYNNGANASFIMDGGKIDNNGRPNLPNLPHFNGGGGVLIAGANSTFVMMGGTISNNIAQSGGGLYAVHLENITIGPNAAFVGNMAYDGLLINDALANKFAYTIRPGIVTHGTHAFNNHDIAVAEGDEIPAETRQLHFSVSGIGGTLSAFLDGIEIQSGDKVPVGSTVIFIATPHEGFAVGPWSMTFTFAGGFDETDDINSLYSEFAPVTFTLRNIQFNHVVNASFIEIADIQS